MTYTTKAVRFPRRVGPTTLLNSLIIRSRTSPQDWQSGKDQGMGQEPSSRRTRQDDMDRSRPLFFSFP